MGPGRSEAFIHTASKPDLQAEASAGTDGFTGGSFETSLSRLTDDQPYLSVGENLENQALFEQLSEAIATVLGENVAAALASGCPAWLNEFIPGSAPRSAPVQDPLLEPRSAPNSLPKSDTVQLERWVADHKRAGDLRIY